MWLFFTTFAESAICCLARSIGKQKPLGVPRWWSKGKISDRNAVRYEKKCAKIRKVLILAAATLLAPVSAYSFADKAALITARDLWLSNEASARSTYGDISGWDVSRIIDMRSLFFKLKPFLYLPSFSLCIMCMGKERGGRVLLVPV